MDRLNLTVVGAGGRAITVQRLEYDVATRTAVYTLAPPLRNETVNAQLNGATTGAVTLAGTAVRLDGEFGGVLPSGNGQAGGNFLVTLRALPGDVTRDGRVDGADLTQVRARLGAAAGPGPAGARYNVFCDINGDGRINVTDLRDVIARLTRTPITPAPATAYVAGALGAAPTVRGRYDAAHELVAGG